MSFAELQTKMQIGKTSKQGVKYTFRNAEDIFTHFKTLNSEYELFKEDEEGILIFGEKSPWPHGIHPIS